MTETTTIMAPGVSTSANSVSKPTGAGTPADALGATKRMSTSDDDANQSDDNVCPECGKELKNQHGMRIHYANAHDGHLYTTQECEWCGDEFRKRPGADRVFCSHECRGNRRSAEGLSARSRQVTLTCEGCDEEFQTAKSNAEAGKKYCSMECYATDSKIHTRECEWCGDEYRGYDRRRFCSQDCYGEWMGEEISPEDHPRWKGGYSQPPTGWVKLRRKCLEKFDYRCQGCGIHEDENRKRHDVGLAVHHIQPRLSFEEPADADTVDNLVPLCRDCHNQWEGLPLRPELID